MTRGTFVYVKDSNCYQSTEFNGDMYLEGRGEDVVLALSAVKNDDDFIKAVVEFNRAHHGYPIDEVEHFIEADVTCLHDLTKKGYFEVWFSDYLYVINLGESFALRDVEKRIVTIPKNTITVLNFGRFYCSFGQSEKGLKLLLETEGSIRALKECEALQKAIIN